MQKNDVDIFMKNPQSIRMLFTSPNHYLFMGMYVFFILLIHIIHEIHNSAKPSIHKGLRALEGLHFSFYVLQYTYFASAVIFLNSYEKITADAK